MSTIATAQRASTTTMATDVDVDVDDDDDNDNDTSLTTSDEGDNRRATIAGRQSLL
jgi:hypothetical protein